MCASHIKQCYWEGTGVLPIQTVCLWGSPVSSCRVHYSTPVCLMSCQEIQLRLMFSVVVFLWNLNFDIFRRKDFMCKTTSTTAVLWELSHYCIAKGYISELVTRGSQVNPWTSRINPGGECVAQVGATVVILAAYRGEFMYLCKCANQWAPQKDSS